MADDPENIILVILRRLDAKLDRVIEDIAELKRQETNRFGADRGARS